MDTTASVVKSIEPKHDFVVVKTDPEIEGKTAGGLIIPAGCLQNKKTMTGEIVAVGPGRENTDGTGRVPMQCKVGDKVILAVFIGYPISIQKSEALDPIERYDDYVIVKDYDIMGIVKRT